MSQATMPDAGGVAAAAPRAEMRTLATISAAHLISHFNWFVFVPILPDLKALLNVSYTELAFALTVMNVVSALTQAPIGFACDRVGARALLVAALVSGGAAFLALAIWPTYWTLMISGVVLAIGNAVYHPADYSVLAAEMSPPRMGRAFATHTFMGYLGFAIAPTFVLAITHMYGAQAALIASGVVGALVALPLLSDLPGERQTLRARGARVGVKGPSALQLLTPAVLLLTLMFTVMSLATSTLQTFMVVGFGERFGLPREVGDWSLSIWMWTMAAGVLTGGFLADRIHSKSGITSGGFGAAAAIVAIVGTWNFGAVGAVALVGLAGFLAGIIAPSRDLLARAASPKEAVGRVFGIVTTGFNFGGMIAPLIGAWFIDHHMPAWIFYMSALFMLITIVLAVKADLIGRAMKAHSA